MTTATPRGSDRISTRSGKVRAARDLAAATSLALAAAGATWWLLGLPASYLLVSAGVYTGLGALVLRGVPTDVRGPGMGPANRVTLARATIAVPIGALALRPAALNAEAQWWIIALSTAVMLLDGVDGRIARRTGTQSAFGARFDMELDAALLMALSVIVWASGKVGAWVLLIGSLRYLFVAAGWLWPRLRAELPESSRRKVACVIQGVVLLVALGPVVPASLSTVVAGVGLGVLSLSFAVDVRWLLLRPH